MALRFRFRSRRHTEPNGPGRIWDAIVCTCQNRESADSFKRELLIRQDKGLLSSHALILAVDDPKPNIGSGSATLNAIICVAEHLAAQEGHKVVTADALYNARILILLLGSTFPFSPCGHAFMPESSCSQPGNGLQQTEVKTNIDRLLEILNQLCQQSPPGVWVASTDMVLAIPTHIEPLDLSSCEDGIGALTVLAKPEHAMLHGACRVTETGEFAQIVHIGGEEKVKQFVRPDGMCDMLTGIVYLSPKASDTMLSIHTMPPLDACTYFGLDNGAQPLSLSLFFDILFCLTTEITHDEYVSGQFKTSGAISLFSHAHFADTPPVILKRARALLWKVLKGLKMKAVPLKGVKHQYLRLVGTDVLARYHNKGSDAHIINSILAPDTTTGSNSVIINCHLESPITVGSNCFVSGLSNSFLELQPSSFLPVPVSIPDNLSVQEIRVSMGRGQMKNNLSVVVIYGVHDDLVAPHSSSGATFCNQPWSEFFKRTGIQASELWMPSAPLSTQTLLNARLFIASHTDLEVGLQELFWLAGYTTDHDTLQRWRSAWRISLADILRCVNTEAEFSHLRDTAFELQRCRMMQALRANQSVCFLPFFRDSILQSKEFDVLATLDEVVGQVEDPLIICRTYSCIADVLGYMGGEGGIRAGPAANVAWRTAFVLLEKGNFHAATRALATERAHWIKGGPDRIIRASRHYEKAGQILTRKAVATARNFIKGTPCTPPPMNKPLAISAPARIDLAGGWTDTPPQAYENGGAVVTLALKIRNEYPVNAYVERIPEPKLILIIANGDGKIIDKIECTELNHLADYSQPHAPGALLKASFICAGIVEFPSSYSLSDQLMTKYGNGFLLKSNANLPQGSGLGTSSILGGVILAGLYKAVGQEHSRDSLIHAVLHLEQLLTTGGGWQDQCGGLYGGAKISHSHKGLPVHITTKQIEPPPGFLATLGDHLVLVYTGKTRLARNLLQDVVRNWHSREARIVQTLQDLMDNAHASEAALERGDMAQIGKCLDQYQKQKLVMAPGSMPKVVSIFIEQIRQHIHGCSLAGAGGGGFLVVIMKDAGYRKTIKDLINSSRVLSDFVVYDVEVDTIGIHSSM